MGQEYFINSQELQDKISNLLPSQGGAGAGFDLSASTQIIPIIDLTESAQGSDVRADLQTSLSLSSVTAFNISNTSGTIISNTGYFRVFGTATVRGAGFGNINLTDGVTTKTIYNVSPNASTESGIYNYDFNLFLKAGDSVICNSTSGLVIMVGSTRQIADINGILVNP
jgi:hypothetical protein